MCADGDIIVDGSASPILETEHEPRLEERRDEAYLHNLHSLQYGTCLHYGSRKSSLKRLFTLFFYFPKVKYPGSHCIINEIEPGVMRPKSQTLNDIRNLPGFTAIYVELKSFDINSPRCTGAAIVQFRFIPYGI